MSERVLQAARRWFARSSGLPLASVIPANAEGPKPDLPFATVLLISQGVRQTKGERYQETVDGELRMNVVQHHGHTLSVNVYGEDASAYIEDACLLVDLDNKQPIGGGGELVVYGCTGATDVSGLLDTSIEPRAQGDFFLRTALTLAQGVATDKAERIITTATLAIGDDEIEQTITVPEE
jgi:hypothetical protein